MVLRSGEVFMKLGSRRFSLHQFQYFLKLIGKEGLIAASTLDQWHEATRELEPLLSRDEKIDLRCVNIKQLRLRYLGAVLERRSAVAPRRVLALEKSLAAALGEFIAFSINPVMYRENRHVPKPKVEYSQEKAVA